MTEILLANLVFFIIPVCGATTFAVCIYWFLRGGQPAPGSPPGGTKTPTPTPSAGPDDLARSA
jgi:hypothetical protein